MVFRWPGTVNPFTFPRFITANLIDYERPHPALLHEARRRARYYCITLGRGL